MKKNYTYKILLHTNRTNWTIRIDTQEQAPINKVIVHEQQNQHTHTKFQSSNTTDKPIYFLNTKSTYSTDANNPQTKPIQRCRPLANAVFYHLIIIIMNEIKTASPTTANSCCCGHQQRQQQLQQCLARHRRRVPHFTTATYSPGRRWKPKSRTERLAKGVLIL